MVGHTSPLLVFAQHDGRLSTTRRRRSPARIWQISVPRVVSSATRSGRARRQALSRRGEPACLLPARVAPGRAFTTTLVPFLAPTTRAHTHTMAATAHERLTRIRVRTMPLCTDSDTRALQPTNIPRSGSVAQTENHVRPTRTPNPTTIPTLAPTATGYAPTHPRTHSSTHFSPGRHRGIAPRSTLHQRPNSRRHRGLSTSSVCRNSK